MLRIISVGVACATAATIMLAGTGFAESDFPFLGTYMQNVPCKGDGTDPPALQVKISSDQIVSNIGVCTILDTKHEGESYTAHVECKFPAGPLVGDITFTPRPDKTIKFVDRDNTYNTVLHRCPD